MAKTKIVLPQDMIRLSEFDEQYGLQEIIQQAQKLNRGRKTASGGKALITLAQLNELSAIRRMGPAEPEQQAEFRKKFRAFLRTCMFDPSEPDDTDSTTPP